MACMLISLFLSCTTWKEWGRLEILQQAMNEERELNIIINHFVPSKLQFSKPAYRRNLQEERKLNIILLNRLKSVATSAACSTTFLLISSCCIITILYMYNYDWVKDGFQSFALNESLFITAHQLCIQKLPITQSSQGGGYTFFALYS